VTLVCLYSDICIGQYNVDLNFRADSDLPEGQLDKSFEVVVCAEVSKIQWKTIRAVFSGRPVALDQILDMVTSTIQVPGNLSNESIGLFTSEVIKRVGFSPNFYRIFPG